MKALPNNNKPATHFVSIYQHTEYGQIQTHIMDISLFNAQFDRAWYLGLNTVAIFKIRLK